MTKNNKVESVADTLKSVFEEVEKENEEEAQEEIQEEATEETEEQSPSEGAPEEEQTSSEEDEEADENDSKQPAEETSEAKVLPSEDTIPAPQHWSQSDRDAFNKLPNEMRKFVLDKEKSIQSNATQKLEEAAEIRRRTEPLVQLFEPYRQRMAMEGVTEQSLIAKYLAYHVALAEKPAETIKIMARDFGVDLTQLNQEDDYVDPAIANIVNQNRQLQQQIQQIQNWQQTSSQQERESWVHEFVNGKDEKGQPLYPHYNDLAKDMEPFMRAASNKMEALQVLKDAYEKALWVNPTTREKHLQQKMNPSSTPNSVQDKQLLEQKKQEILKKNAERVAEVKKAKNAATALKPSPSKKAGQAPKDTRSVLEQEYERMMAR